MSVPIRVGIVGLSAAGWASSALAPSILSVPKYKLTALSTSNASSASATAQAYTAQVGNPVNAHHGPTTSIAADPDVDLIVVSVRAKGHLSAVLPAIEAGKDIFVEWPVGANLEETKEIARRAREKGVRAAVGLQGRHSAVIRKAKELIESGKIGKVLSTTSINLVPEEFGIWGPVVNERSKFAAEVNSGSTLLDIPVGHHLDILTFVIGSYFSSISTTSAILFPKATVIDAAGAPIAGEDQLTVTAPDHYAYTGVLKSGAVASVVWRAGLKSTPGRRQFLWEIDGEEGSIKLESDEPLAAFINFKEPTLWLNGEKVEVDGAENPTIGNLRAEWEEFAKGEQGNYATLEDAVRNRTVLDAIRRSGEEGKRIVLE
ncbi:hypothetical protein DXG03_008313 [Asterophora parasitica]|uniref:Oxidoreductase n=1 Tax=Asterophora parasitica TaxID=117018 RepID=A0A9P7KAD3_9AGAR|nr:hypothetical protein DXG03_008313 [Asterophora parasitica]